MKSGIQEFCETRLKGYEKRRKLQLKKMEKDLLKQENKIRFLKAVISGELKVFMIAKDTVIESLEEAKYTKFSEKEDGIESYNYLLDMKFTNATLEKVKELETKISKQKGDIKTLKGNSARDIWKSEIREFEVEYGKYKKEKK